MKRAGRQFQRHKDNYVHKNERIVDLRSSRHPRVHRKSSVWHSPKQPHWGHKLQPKRRLSHWPVLLLFFPVHLGHSDCLGKMPPTGLRWREIKWEEEQVCAHGLTADSLVRALSWRWREEGKRELGRKQRVPGAGSEREPLSTQLLHYSELVVLCPPQKTCKSRNLQYLQM